MFHTLIITIGLVLILGLQFPVDFVKIFVRCAVVATATQFYVCYSIRNNPRLVAERAQLSAERARQREAVRAAVRRRRLRAIL